MAARAPAMAAPPGAEAPSARWDFFPVSPTSSVARTDSECGLPSGPAAATRRLPLPAWRVVLTVAVATVLMGAVTLGASIVASLLTRDSYVGVNHELTTRDGLPVVTRASLMHSYSALTDLPLQGHAFLEQMTGISLWTDGELRFFHVAGFRWANTSYMVLETVCRREIVVAAGKAFLREPAPARGGAGASSPHHLRTTRATTPASEPRCGRRLGAQASGSGGSGRIPLPGPRRYEDLVARYHAESARTAVSSAGGRRWRRLDEEPLAGRSDLYEWFGALAISDASAEEHADLAAEALEAAYCDYDTRGLECAAYESSRDPQPPQLSEYGLNRFLLAGGGSTWLLYLDLSDWDPRRDIPVARREVRSKLAQGVLPDASVHTGSAIRVVESHGSKTWTYQFMHPSVNPEVYNMTPLTAVGDNLLLAEALLESAAFDSRKGECRELATGEAPDPPQASDVSIAFDCETGTYVWSVGGWRVSASADGEVKAFAFGDSRKSAEVEDDDSSSRLYFRVLAFSDGADSRANFKLNNAFNDGTIFLGCASNGQRKSESSGRGLSLRHSLPGIRLPGTYWCGPGQDPRTDNFCLTDFGGDWACRRHDACRKFESLGPLPVLGCSCDRDLADACGRGPQASLIRGLLGGNGVWPCIAHTETCQSWGWLPGGRRRRWGWRYWGITGEYECSNWNYVNKFSGKLTEWGYFPAMNNFSLDSQTSWPGCYPNKRDIPNGKWFR
eukprot:TRINITY_DN22902_c0_g1_i1.p1 TRINITY_DN22902_c0_g1~~TRINITY_DN22902_c0_g1_i1.p1  ORF type:complete len:748 (+),score=98.36 TRINITY_DN22902_c0_g1_i1:55-2244(+)